MRVLLVGSREFERHAFRSVLERLSPGVEISEFAALDEAVEVCPTMTDWDLVILDQRLPGMDRIAGTDFFPANHPKARTLLLSCAFRCEGDHVIATLNRGAAGFVLVFMGNESLLIALKLVLLGAKVLWESVLGDGEERPGRTPRTRAGNEEANLLQGLTARQREVLDHLMDGLSNKEIARELDVAEVTVKLHVRAILRQLRAANRAQAVRLALEHGWQAQTP